MQNQCSIRFAWLKFPADTTNKNQGRGSTNQMHAAAVKCTIDFMYEWIEKHISLRFGRRNQYSTHYSVSFILFVNLRIWMNILLANLWHDAVGEDFAQSALQMRQTNTSTDPLNGQRPDERKNSENHSSSHYFLKSHRMQFIEPSKQSQSQ